MLRILGTLGKLLVWRSAWSQATKECLFRETLYCQENWHCVYLIQLASSTECEIHVHRHYI